MITIAHQHQLVVIVTRQRQKDVVAAAYQVSEPTDLNIINARKF